MNTYQAKRIPLQNVLSRIGHEPHHTAKGELWYLSPFRNEDTASFKINTERNVWYDFGLGKGGNILDFVMQYYQVSTISEALSQLDNMEGWVKREPPAPLPEKTTERDLGTALSVDKIQPLQNRALIQYLRGRGIDAATAFPYVQEIYYMHNYRKYFALAFPNHSGGYEMRNPYFKGVYGHKDISLISGQKNEAVMVFEGFMDFLSYLVSSRQHQPEYPAIVLNSIAMGQKALDTIKQMGVREVHLYLDLDQGGRELTGEFQRALEGITVLDKSGLYQGYKDFNEYLKQRQMELC